MVLVPRTAPITFTATSTVCLGCKDVKITEKTTMKEITCDAATSVARLPTIFDADFSATFIADQADAGQDLIRAAKASKALITYTVVKGGATSVLAAYVESITYPGGPADEQLMEVGFSVSGGCATTYA
jgi:hypothetical protein